MFVPALAKQNMPPLNSPTNMSDRKMSALTHAAQISPLVNKLTIGPDSRETSASLVLKEPSSMSSLAPPVQSKWRKDVWRTVRDVDDDDDNGDSNRSKTSNRSTILTLVDCKAVCFKMSMRTAERNRQNSVRQQMLERQRKQDDQLSQLMANMKVAATTPVADEATDQAMIGTIAALRRMDEEARHREEQTARELAENRQRQLERFDHLRRDDEIHECCEQIKSQKNLFIMLYERFVKVLLMGRDQLATGGFAEYQRHQNEFFARYESIINRVNSGRISMEEVNMLEQLCDDVKVMHVSVETDVQRNAEELEKIQAADLAAAKSRQEAAAAAELARKETELQESMLAAQAALVAPQGQPPPPPLPPTYIDNVDAAAAIGLQHFVSPERLQNYEQIMAFYEQYAQSVKPLQADERMKEYRFFCQKAVNTPLNSISAVSAEHLQDTFVRLGCFLAGTSVKVGDVEISSTAHPLGIRFCTLLVAKKLVVSIDNTCINNSYFL